ncbi:ParB/RepB/Spo0J family partition protein [Trueperella pyogenes]|uniref:ParB/RepB/Spo0J family partition protein n=3 Tax=Trueperella pyogenes TaxID=1661 RepID=A0A3S9QM87_9ACTO|nr:ParB/RepB/Spo0J family partition protein [Trueperella pyogenes]AWG03687.1 chromosome partitioning protein ParB [Trueperella pyogenes]AWG16418.1 chromosome partitioning protein ParB [Trueperella pyogenes]AZR05298.1 ParB/RepB/Spo0J family partition protein [Trueperella pyogenes]AZR07070.1 ParB/RepB/Spo0J family partition protein [Trueperella pyogenes]QIU87286.1 ParB/RepB/Spo0J family partition protein [Trueperella pyogenes]
MAEKRRGLGRGLGALFPEEQKEHKSRATDVFFSSPRKDSSEDGETGQSLAKKPGQRNVGRATGKLSETASTQKNVSRETLKGATEERKNSKLSASGKKTQGNTGDNHQHETGSELLPVPGATFGEIAVNAIVPNMRQPREIFDEDELQELADSIAEVGILQPIVIRPLSAPIEDNPQARYELIMGERRWRASQRAGKETIPAIVRHTEDSDLLRDALLENLHRANLNALEEAAAYQQLLEDFQCTQEELSRRIARSRPQISNTLRLLKLPPLVQRRVAANVLSAGHARALLGLTDPAAMERLAQRIVAEGMSVRQVEEIVALGEDNLPAQTPGTRRSRYSEELNELANRLSDRFNTRVKVNMGVRKGKIAIEFATIEDLNRILDDLSEENVAVENRRDF